MNPEDLLKRLAPILRDKPSDGGGGSGDGDGKTPTGDGVTKTDPKELLNPFLEEARNLRPDIDEDKKTDGEGDGDKKTGGKGEEEKPEVSEEQQIEDELTRILDDIDKSLGPDVTKTDTPPAKEPAPLATPKAADLPPKSDNPLKLTQQHQMRYDKIMKDVGDKNVMDMTASDFAFLQMYPQMLANERHERDEAKREAQRATEQRAEEMGRAMTAMSRYVVQKRTAGADLSIEKMDKLYTEARDLLGKDQLMSPGGWVKWGKLVRRLVDAEIGTTRPSPQQTDAERARLLKATQPGARPKSATDKVGGRTPEQIHIEQVNKFMSSRRRAQDLLLKA